MIVTEIMQFSDDVVNTDDERRLINDGRGNLTSTTCVNTHVAYTNKYSQPENTHKLRGLVTHRNLTWSGSGRASLSDSDFEY